MAEKLQHIALGIICRDEDVLLIERRQKSGKNSEVLNLVFPRGRIEIGEDPFTAAERGVFEETGYIVQATK